MSRIGKNPIQVPSGVKVNIAKPRVDIEGPKGKLSFEIPQAIDAAVKENVITVTRTGDTGEIKALHGLVRALLQNMIIGVTQGYKKELEIIGVGYKATMKSKDVLNLQIGFSHPVEMPVWKGLTVATPAPTRITIEGIDKQQVGEYAARIRRVAPPEPYQGKGIRYAGEQVRKKLGKAMSK